MGNDRYITHERRGITEMIIRQSAVDIFICQHFRRCVIFIECVKILLAEMDFY